MTTLEQRISHSSSSGSKPLAQLEEAQAEFLIQLPGQPQAHDDSSHYQLVQRQLPGSAFCIWVRPFLMNIYHVVNVTVLFNFLNLFQRTLKSVCMYLCIRVHVHTHTHSHIMSHIYRYEDLILKILYVCVYACVYTYYECCTHAHTYTYTHIYTHMMWRLDLEDFVCVDVCMCVHIIWKCIHTHARTYTQRCKDPILKTLFWISTNNTHVFKLKNKKPTY